MLYKEVYTCVILSHFLLISSLICSRPLWLSNMKTLQGRFHQGDFRFSIETRGRQCVPCCLIFLICISYHCENNWTEDTLYDIIKNGDALYGLLKCKKNTNDDFLLSNELPSKICCDGLYFTIKVIPSFYGILGSEYLQSDIGSTLSISLKNAFKASNCCILIMRDYAIAVAKKEDKFHLFDSHSRNEIGLPVSDGACIQMIFGNYSDLIVHLNLLSSALNADGAQYEAVPLKIRKITRKTVVSSKQPITTLRKEPSAIGNGEVNVTAEICLVHKTQSKDRKVEQPNAENRSKYEFSDVNRGMKPLKKTNERGMKPLKKTTNQRGTKPLKKTAEQRGMQPLKKTNPKRMKLPSSTKKNSVETGAKLTKSTNANSPDLNFDCSVTTVEPFSRLAACDNTEVYSDSHQLVTDQITIDHPDDAIQKNQNLIKTFKQNTSSGPYYVCSCCHQTWFRHSVLKTDKLRMLSHDIIATCLTNFKSVDGTEWICLTCNTYLRKYEMPPCATANQMYFPNKPPDLDLTPLEERLVSPRIPFMQIHSKPCGGQLSIIGNVVNVPANVNNVVHSLPRTLNDNETVQVKLKRKRSYKHHVSFESVRSNKVYRAAKWLVENSVLYQKEGIVLNSNFDQQVSSNAQADCSDEQHAVPEIDGPCSDCLSQKQPRVLDKTLSAHHSDNVLQSQNVDQRKSEKNQTETFVECQSSSHVTCNCNMLDVRLSLSATHAPIVETETFSEVSDICQTHSLDNEMHVCPSNNQIDNTSGRNICNQKPQTSLNEKQVSRDSQDDDWSEDENELQPVPAPDTLLQAIDYGEITDILEYSPGEGNKPLGLFYDLDAEFLAFPTIFCGETLPDNKERKVPVHYSTVCKWQARHIDRRVARHVPNLFFKVKRLQLKQLKDKVNIAVRKIKGRRGKKLTAGDLLQPGVIDNLVKLDEGYKVLRTLRGSPPYWEQTKKDLFAMIRQLGIPTYFVSFSAAETRWMPLLRTLSKLLDSLDLTDEQITVLSWKEKCRLIRSDPITCARYFDQKFNMFMKTVLKSSLMPIGEVAEYFGRIEFQSRGSAHVHMLIWIKNAPVYGKDTDEDVIAFHDRYITCNSDCTELTCLQTHKHSRTCRKRGAVASCRFNYPLPPMPSTKILQPLPPNERPLHRNNHEMVTKHLQQMAIDNRQSFNDFLADLDMTYIEYENALRYSLTGDKIFMRRNTHETRINAYNTTLLRSWEANMDIQFVLDPYACAAYIVSYMTKGQRGMSRLLYEACNEVRSGNKDIRQQVRHIGNKFLSSVEICAQEAAWHVLQLPLRKASRSFCFINTSPPDERTFMLKSHQQLSDLPSNSTSVDSDNMIKRYTRRPKILESLCLADFAAHYEVCHSKSSCSKRTSNYDSYLLEDLPDDDNVDDQTIAEPLQSTDVSNCINESLNENCIPLERLDSEKTDPQENQPGSTYTLYGGLTVKKRAHAKIIRYVRYNKTSDPENHYRELLMLFFPWRNEKKIIGNCHKYHEKFKLEKQTVIKNQAQYNRNANILECIEENLDEICLREDISPNCQHQDDIQRTQSEDLRTYGCFDPDMSETPVQADIGQDLGLGPSNESCTISSSLLLPDENYRALIRSLNAEQRYFYEHVIHHFKTSPEPLYNFLTGGAGVGKSMLTKALYETLVRYYNSGPASNPDDVKVLLCAPTGKAAFNIGGSTLHSTFNIPVSQSLKYIPLPLHALNTMRVKLANLKIIFIDEISMVGNRMFNFINLRLQEVTGCSQPFGGISVIAIGDLFQLQPVMDRWIFQINSDEYGPLASSLWQDQFTMFELTVIMRQKDDASFAQLLNRLRTGSHTASDISELKTCLKCPEDPTIKTIPHLFTTNAAVDNHNRNVFLESPTTDKAEIVSVDTVVGDVSDNLKAEIISRIPHHPTKTMGLMGKCPVALNQRVDISVNVSVDDGLVNGASGIVRYLDYRVSGSNRCSIVWIKFDNKRVGEKVRLKYHHLYYRGICATWTPIFEVSRQFSVGRNKNCFVLRRQFPLRPSCAKTIHKSQGDTMPNAVVHMGNRKQQHMHYVAFSRVQNLQGLNILELNENKISVSSDVKAEMVRLATLQVQSCIPAMCSSQSEPTSLKILFFNCRSLHAHYEDLKAHHMCLQADIVGIAESRLVSTDVDHDYALDGYSIRRFDFTARSVENSRPHYGLAIYSKYPLLLEQKLNILDMQIYIFQVTHQNNNIQIAFLYCPPKQSSLFNLKKAFQLIMSSVANQQKVVIAGDCNYDLIRDTALTEHANAKHDLQQIIQGPTTDYGSLLDHIYTDIPQSSILSFGTLEAYYSDHKPIFMTIS